MSYEVFRKGSTGIKKDFREEFPQNSGRIRRVHEEFFKHPERVSRSCRPHCVSGLAKKYITYQILIQFGGKSQQLLLVTFLHGFLQLFFGLFVVGSLSIHQNSICELFGNVHEPVPDDGIGRFVVNSGYQLPQLFPLSATSKAEVMFL